MRRGLGSSGSWGPSFTVGFRIISGREWGRMGVPEDLSQHLSNGGRLSPMPPQAAERRLAAIMFTDIVGYTALMAESQP